MRLLAYRNRRTAGALVAAVVGLAPPAAYTPGVVSQLPPAVRRALEAYRDRLRPLFGDRLRDVRLFGSYARAEADEDSDVDVLVVIDALEDREIGVVAGEVMPIVLSSGLSLSPLPMATERLARLRDEGRALAREIDEEGVSL
jgi:uncharacterized protein